MLTRRMMVAGAGVAVTGIATAGVARADMPALVEAARKEGALSWYTAHTDGETAQATLEAFMRSYPFIKGSVIRTTAQVGYQRLLQDIKNGIANCDVYSSTDLGHDETLKAQGKFVKWVPEGAAALLPTFQGLDPGGTYYPTLAELVLPIFNSAKVKAVDAPQSWPDLLNPKWRGQVAVGHPAYSGTVGTWVVMIRKMYGWSYFERLEKNRPLIGRSVNDAVGVINSGERMVAAGPSALSQVQAARGNPVGLTYPTDGAAIIVSPSAVMANAPHPNAARLFVEFLLSAEHAKLSADGYRGPVRAGAVLQPGVVPLADVKVNRLTTAEIVAGIPEVIEQWRDTFGS